MSASSRVSEETWRELEQKPQNEQKQFLEERLEMFRDEEATQWNVKRGDQLFCKGAFGVPGDHHFLCIEVSENSIKIVEYSGPGFASSASAKSFLSSNPLALGTIGTRTLTFKDLEEKKVTLRKWPEELKRFSVDEVIERATRRLNERDYHPFDNNCECFVVWCKCGLNTSLQVKQWYRTAWEGVKAGRSGVLEGVKNYGVQKAIPVVAKVFGKFSSKMARVISGSCRPVSVVIGGGIEVGFAVWNMKNDLTRYVEGRSSDNEVMTKIIGASAKFHGHFFGGIAGSFIGSAFGPLGIPIGGGIGNAAGHVVGSGVELIAKKCLCSD